MPRPDPSMEHREHVHQDDGSGQSHPPQSLSDHLKTAVHHGLSTAEEYAKGAESVVRNLTGAGEVGKIATDLTGGN